MSLERIKELFKDQVEWYDSKMNFEEAGEDYVYDECPEAFCQVKRGTWMKFLEILNE